MLYILPPLRSQDPPASWNNLIDNNNKENLDRGWTKPPKIKLRNLKIVPKINDESSSDVHSSLDANRNTSKSLSECYFAGKGTALVLPDADAAAQYLRSDVDGVATPNAEEEPEQLQKPQQQQQQQLQQHHHHQQQRPILQQTVISQGGAGGSSTIQRHLQSMFYLLRPEETLKMAVKLESVHPTRTRYLVVVSRMGDRGEESCLLGIDCNEETTVGLVLRVLADTKITLDGDGGFSVSVCDKHHIFKPVSVQAMWSALQTLHKVSAKAREGNYFQGGGTHAWVEHYEKRVSSDRSCLNEWHAMDCLESRRPPSPDSIRTRPIAQDETDKIIRSTLKEIMMSVDLDEVTSKFIRSRLEEELDMDLGEYKSFIDEEMLVILGQMDAPTEIFDHVYLGSEWNASNYEELQRNGVRHILNVTREIDNFFPGTFDYLNVRVYDDEQTDLLKHWDDTFKYITKARNEGSKVLVHCKMGISRSASVVIAYAMKAYNWDFNKALHHVKEKRSCIKPNTNFLTQLETYQGILDAMKNKEKLQRSKSETNLKSPTNNNNSTSSNDSKTEKPAAVGSEPASGTEPPSCKSYDLQSTLSGQDLRQLGARPKSWSPDNLATKEIKESIKSSSGFLSLEDLSQRSGSKESVQDSKSSLARHVLMPCDNGKSYSVSPNQIVHLTEHSSCNNINASDIEISEKSIGASETWDPGEQRQQQQQQQQQSIQSEEGATSSDSRNSNSTTSAVCDRKLDNSDDLRNAPVWTSSAIVVTQSAVPLSSFSKVPESRLKTDPFSNQLDRVFDKEEKKEKKKSTGGQERECPSRQSSWSSYDSAVAMGFPEKNELSRHSSWGSGDTRLLPSRNSSWGSYDLKPRGSVYYKNEKGEKILHTTSDLSDSASGIFPYDREDIPWHPGTVKRTKQRLERTNRQLSNDSVTSSNLSLTKTPSSETLLMFNFAEAINETLVERGKTTATTEINIPNVDKCLPPLSPSSARLSVSAPEPCSMELVVQETPLSRSTSNVDQEVTTSTNRVKKQTSFLENLHKDSIQTAAKKIDIEDNNIGKVQNLKKEFEAKSSFTSLEQGSEQENMPKTKNRTATSVPSSPVCVHVEKEQRGEDLSFKTIRSVFENHNNAENGVKLRQKCSKSNNKTNSRYSCFEVSMDKSPHILSNTLISNLKADTEYKRPPIVPAVKQIAATVIATAAKKQQQYGKTHPLAKINIRPRHNNPVYNTM